MKKSPGVFILLFISLVLGRAQTIPMGALPVGGGGSTGPSYISVTTNFTTCGATAVSICTLTATVTGGQGLIFCGQGYAATAATFSSASGDSGSWVHPTGAQSMATSSNAGHTHYNISDCVYLLSATGGVAETFTWNWSAAANTDIELAIISEAGGVTYDTSAALVNTSCTTACATPALTLHGSHEYILTTISSLNNPSAPGAPYTTPSVAEASGNVVGGVAGAQNQSSGAAVNWSQGSAARAGTSAIAFY